MSKVVRHLRQNAVAYLALFVALGGTSYAAISIPRNSVGNRQLKNHSVRPIKFDRNTIGGYVRMWARVSADGKIIASRPTAKVVVWDPVGGQTAGGELHWMAAVPTNCFTLASTEPTLGASYVSAKLLTGNARFGTLVRISLSAFDPVNVAVICPQP